MQLAPRDVVSRTILSEMRLQRAPHMYLDISHRPADWIRGRFPSIYEHCLRHGLDMTVQPLPVVPAAHYFCGGVATDLVGRTTVPGLFAAGESEGGPSQERSFESFWIFFCLCPSLFWRQIAIGVCGVRF